MEATWRDFGGASGAGTASQLTGETGYFYFFSPNNLEVMVKALNGCDRSLGHHFWIYGAGLTNVQVELKATDTLTGEVKLYYQPAWARPSSRSSTAAPSPPATPRRNLFRARPAGRQGRPVGGARRRAAGRRRARRLLRAERVGALPELCLGGRFRIRATWHTLNGASGVGRSRQITHETGTFSFFSPENLELVVKVLDACHTAAPAAGSSPRA